MPYKDPEKAREYQKRWYRANRKKHNTRMQHWYLRNRKQHLANTLQWHRDNPEKSSAIQKKYSDTHVEKLRAKSKKWHREKYQKFRKQRLIKRREMLAQLRLEVLKFFGGKCRQCGIADKRVLQVDHKNGGGYKDKGNTGSPTYYRRVLADDGKNYQLLCANCNWIKRYQKKEMPKRTKL